MHHSKVETKEKYFKSNKASQFTMEPFEIPIPNSEEVLEGMVCRPAAGYTNYYYNEAVEKDQIVLHHTAGNLQGDLGALTKENWHVSVAFVIARDGTIYQLHGSNQWSHHLGPKSWGGNKTQSRR
ncbi:MAG: N-acetylmuramoyl-L-alanine amidase, partial [Saprospiraceae bacterium]